jgi:hypothetical protein
MKYFKPKGNRIKSYGWFGVMISFDDPNQSNYIWVHESEDDFGKGHWGKREEAYPFGASSHFSYVKSFKAFRRRLKQWKTQLPKGTKLLLVSRWHGGYDIESVIK